MKGHPVPSPGSLELNLNAILHDGSVIYITNSEIVKMKAGLTPGQQK